MASNSGGGSGSGGMGGGGGVGLPGGGGGLKDREYDIKDQLEQAMAVLEEKHAEAEEYDLYDPYG